MNVTHRLSKFITLKKMNPYSFKIACGLTKNIIQKPVKNGTLIGLPTLSKISETFPELSLNWLITGQGSMLLDGTPQPLNNEKQTELEFEIKFLKDEYFDCLREKDKLQKELNALQKKWETAIANGGKPELAPHERKPFHEK